MLVCQHAGMPIVRFTFCKIVCKDFDYPSVIKNIGISQLGLAEILKLNISFTKIV